MTMQETKTNIKNKKEITEKFDINKVQQKDSLSTTPFNRSLEYVTRKNNKGKLITGEGKVIAKTRKNLKKIIELGKVKQNKAIKSQNNKIR